MFCVGRLGASEKMFIFEHEVKEGQNLGEIFLEYIKQGSVIDKYSITTKETIRGNKGVDLQKLTKGQRINVHISVKDIDPYRIPKTRLENSSVSYGKYDYMISLGTGYRMEEKNYSFITGKSRFSYNMPLLLNARAFENFKNYLNIYFSLQTNLIRSDIETPRGVLKSKPELSLALGYNFIRNDDYIPLFLNFNKFTDYNLKNSNGTTTVSLSDELSVSAMVGYLYRFSVRRHMGDIFITLGSDVVGKEKKKYILETYYDQEIFKRFGLTVKLHYSKTNLDTQTLGGFTTLSYFY